MAFILHCSNSKYTYVQQSQSSLHSISIPLSDFIKNNSKLHDFPFLSIAGGNGQAILLL